VHAHVPKKFKNFNKCQSNKCQGHSLTVEGRSPEKKVLSYGFCPNEGGGRALPKFFGTYSRGAFLANKGVYKIGSISSKMPII